MFLVARYLVANKYFALIAFYFAVSVLLKIGFSVDIFIPCLWKTLFHFNCPGCGLTTAFIQLINFDFSGAFDSNPLIFIIMPLGVTYIANDFMRFKRRYKFENPYYFHNGSL
jgi:hypothetical protein